MALVSWELLACSCWFFVAFSVAERDAGQAWLRISAEVFFILHDSPTFVLVGEMGRRCPARGGGASLKCSTLYGMVC